MTIQINSEQAYAYAELLEVLSFFDEEEVNKIPKKLMNVFRENALSTYKPHLTSEIELEEQEMSQKTISLLAMLTLNYWCNSPEEKKVIEEILIENQKNKEQELRNKYNPDNIFNNVQYKEETKNNSTIEFTDNNSSNNTIENNNLLPIDYTSLSIFQKIQVAFKKFINKFFKKNNPI